MKTNYSEDNLLKGENSAPTVVQPHFRSHLLDNLEEPPADECEDFDEQKFVTKSIDPLTRLVGLIKPALLLWMLFAALYFMASIFLFKPGTAVSDGFSTYTYKGSPELRVNFNYTIAGHVFQGNEGGITDNDANRQIFAAGEKIAIFYNPLNHADYEASRDEKLMVIFYPAILIFSLLIAPYLPDRGDCMPPVLPSKKRLSLPLNMQ